MSLDVEYWKNLLREDQDLESEQCLGEENKSSARHRELQLLPQIVQAELDQNFRQISFEECIVLFHPNHFRIMNNGAGVVWTPKNYDTFYENLDTLLGSKLQIPVFVFDEEGVYLWCYRELFLQGVITEVFLTDGTGFITNFDRARNRFSEEKTIFLGGSLPEAFSWNGAELFNGRNTFLISDLIFEDSSTSDTNWRERAWKEPTGGHRAIKTSKLINTNY